MLYPRMTHRLYIALVGLTMVGAAPAPAQVAPVGFEGSAPRLEAPEVRLRDSDLAATAGRAHTLEFEVSWMGPPGAFIVSPLIIPKVSGGSLRLGPSFSESEGGVHRIVQRVEVVADTPGSLRIPSLEIPYRERSIGPAEPRGDGTAEAPEMTTSLFTEAVEISVSEPRRWGVILGGSGAFVLVATIASVALYRRRRREISPPVSVPSGLATARDALHAAKKYRLDGDYYRFFGALRNGARVFAQSPEAARLLASLEDQAQDAGFRGGRPTDEAMDGAIRDYQRVMHAQSASSGGPRP